MDPVGSGRLPWTDRDHDGPRGVLQAFCGSCNCGCPELHIDDAAAPERRVVITDDFGQRIQMSLEQLADLVADVRKGVLDEVLAPAG